jgi:hypothetical protein
MSTSKNLLYYSIKSQLLKSEIFLEKNSLGTKQDFVNILMDVYLFIINITNMKEKEEETTSGPY